jgi:hypothetical protein
MPSTPSACRARILQEVLGKSKQERRDVNWMRETAQGEHEIDFDFLISILIFPRAENAVPASEHVLETGSVLTALQTALGYLI